MKSLIEKAKDKRAQLESKLTRMSELVAKLETQNQILQSAARRYEEVLDQNILLERKVEELEKAIEDLC